MEDQRKKPIRLVKVSGGVTIGIWQDGNKQYYTLDKVFKDKNSGEWRKSHYYFPEQMAKIRQVLINEFPELNDVRLPSEPENDDDLPF